MYIANGDGNRSKIVHNNMRTCSETNVKMLRSTKIELSRCKLALAIEAKFAWCTPRKKDYCTWCPQLSGCRYV